MEDNKVYVYILNSEGQPLMPTSRCGKVHRLLKSKKAKVVKKCPFTIQLLYKTKTEYTQPITLGIDAGSKHIGVSASTEEKELYSAIVELRNDIVKNMSTRKEFRRTRRNRKIRYRKPRFNNRTKPKQKGWVAPSIRVKIENHLKEIEDVFKILPISKAIIEVANFDIQLLKAQIEGKPLPQGIDYQQGEQYGSWNIREYVLMRDNYTCQHCHGKSGDKVLNTHHLESRKTGGNAPNNLLTLCSKCHEDYHKGIIKLKKKRLPSFRDSAYMNIMKWKLVDYLKEKYDNVSYTYGYITKAIRIENNLSKSHNIDALCIAKHPKAKILPYYFQKKKVRNHNRQIHKATIGKGGVRKLNQAPFIVKGFRLFDKVKYKGKGKECFISGRRSTGYFALVDINGNSVHKSAKYIDLKLIEPRKSTLTSIVKREALS